MIGRVASSPSRAKSATLRSIRWSANPRWMRLMMSLRSPSARITGSAFSHRCHRAGPSGSARPRRSSLRMRPIMADRGCPSGGRSAAGRRLITPSCCAASLERTVEPGPTIRLGLGLEVAADLEVAARPELEGGEMRGAGAHAPADVVAGNDEVAAVVAFAPHDDMDVGIIGIPMIDPNPIQPGAEIPLGLRHQIPGERLQIGELLRILRGHDEPEMMPIPFAAVGEGAVVGVIVFG